MNKKYSDFLAIILVLIIIAIIGIIAYLGYKYYETYVVKSSSEEFVGSFNEDMEEETSKKNEKKDDDDNSIYEGVDEGTTEGNNSGDKKVKTYNGFVVSGTIEIPATNMKGPIIAQSDYSLKALETSVIEIYGDGLNQVGNTTIVGHNYRNGTFFSNNKKLKIGDKIYITDLDGKRLTYTIYDKFETEENDSDYMVRDTQGAIEISLSTCTDDSKARLIILARANV